MARNATVTPLALLFVSLVSGCAGFKSMMGVEGDRRKLISNPFYSYQAADKNEPGQNMILRTKKGDRSVELEIPGGTDKLSDFVLPVAPAFKESPRTTTSADGTEMPMEQNIQDESYKTTLPTSSDREITQNFSQGSPDTAIKRNEIEKGLNLAASADDNTPTEGASSYLAALDHIKLLFRSMRYEAALLEVDGMIRIYQTDPRLHEMRGTLLDRLGQRDLAIKSWSQALRFNPKNESLRKFIDRKMAQSTAGGP
jgi:tetratricopeptide (TPR) repeat protein